MPKRVQNGKIEAENDKKKKKPRIAANGHKLPDQIPSGQILTDVLSQKWRLGKPIGLGGFGEIYLASDIINKAVTSNSTYVIKIEDHSNGPLFTEMHFYHRVGKTYQIDEWMKAKKLQFLGMPRFIASGSHEYKGSKYRFLVMDRFGEDLQKVFEKHNRLFPVKTVLTLGVKILDILEYIHSFGYIHADVKASNLLLGFGQDKESQAFQVYLVDFGLACKYRSANIHKEYKEDYRKAHDGTIEFTSRDAHIGAHARRSDLEVLGYNLLQWMCQRLPWEDNLKDLEWVSEEKQKYMSDIPLLLRTCFQKKLVPPGIGDFLRYVSNLGFEDEPNYNLCREILLSAITKAGYKHDGKIIFEEPVKKRPDLTITIKTNMVVKNPNILHLLDKQAFKSRMNGLERKLPASALMSINSSPRHPRRSTSAATCFELAKLRRDVVLTDNSLENPTPAMLAIMKRRMEKQKLEKIKQNALLMKNNNHVNLTSKSKKKIVAQTLNRGKNKLSQAKNFTPFTLKKMVAIRKSIRKRFPNVRFLEK